MGKGSKHNLSKEVIAALPSDLDSQLDVANQITNYAVSGRVAKLEAETANLRQKVAEKEQIISGLQKRVIAAETTLEETTAKLNIALEGQVDLHLVSHNFFQCCVQTNDSTYSHSTRITSICFYSFLFLDQNSKFR